MTASLPADVQDVFARFITTELTTVDHGGRPITWPVTPYYERGGPCIDVSTGLGTPRKASDARANPQVALLFSEPTGSGLHDPPMVLVQGSADVDDVDLEANAERYARESMQKLPSLAAKQPPRALRRALAWYYDRIYIRVRPERVYVWPHGDLDGEPELFDTHMEEVRSGHSEEPERFHAAPSGGLSVWDDRINELGPHPPALHTTAVLSVVCPDGFPFAVRVGVRLDPAARWIEIAQAPEGLPLAPGRACMTAHRHDERFTWTENFQVRGDLVAAGGGWALIPRKLVGGFEAPRSRLALVCANAGKARRYHRTAKRELARRR